MTTTFCPPYLFERTTSRGHSVWKQTVLNDTNRIYQKIGNSDFKEHLPVFKGISAGRQTVCEMRVNEDNTISRYKEFYRLKHVAEDKESERIYLHNHYNTHREDDFFATVLPQTEKDSEHGRKWKQHIDEARALRLAQIDRREKELEEWRLRWQAETKKGEEDADVLDDEFGKLIVSLGESPMAKVLSALKEEKPFKRCFNHTGLGRLVSYLK